MPLEAVTDRTAELEQFIVRLRPDHPDMDLVLYRDALDEERVGLLLAIRRPEKDDQYFIADRPCLMQLMNQRKITPEVFDEALQIVTRLDNNHEALVQLRADPWVSERFFFAVPHVRVHRTLHSMHSDPNIEDPLYGSFNLSAKLIGDTPRTAPGPFREVKSDGAAARGLVPNHFLVIPTMR